MHTNNDVPFYNQDFEKIKFITNQRHILAVDLDEINLNDDNNFDEDDGDIIFHLRFLICPGKFEKRKALKKDK